ncbi:MAG: glycoside hydrolase family 5 protein [Bacteroidales bacterium]|nr:glycoside hydrolase family 5 protein [Bacteroidales bacterium]
MRSKFYTLLLVFLFTGYVYSQTNGSITDVKPFGLNLAGGEFGKAAGVYGKNYTYPTTESLDHARTNGFKLIRMPFLWERIQPVLGGNLDVLEVDRIREVLSNARSRGLLVILDMHNYCRRTINGKSKLINSSEVSLEKIADAWMKIAEVFKDEENIWGYGLMNEPHDMASKEDWFNIAQAVITKIRIVDTKTTILVGGDRWSSAEKWPQYSNNLKYLVDPSNNIIFEAHVYFDKNGSGKYKGTYEEEKTTPMTGVLRVTPFVRWLKKNKLKGFIGEYGVPDDDPRWLVTLDNFLDYLKKNNVNGTYWAAGSKWGKYRLSVESRDGIERPQMKILSKYLFSDQSNTH